VCESINLANQIFQTGGQLIQSVPANWKMNAICLALQNLELQGDCALALLAKIGTLTTEEEKWDTTLNGYLKIIQWNRGLLGTQCNAIAQNKANQENIDVQRARNALEANKLYWEDKRLKWKMARDVTSSVFNATKWAVQSAYTMSIEQPGISLASAAAAYYFWNKLFGLPTKR
jgi:hypothetical protein